MRLFEELAEILAGKKGRETITFLLKNRKATDEEISRKLRISVNETRVILHKLFDGRLLRYERTRDKKIGWYTYFWEITNEPIEVVLKERKRKVIEKLEKKLEYEKSNTFYICPNNDIPRLTFDEAFNNMFKCPVCGSILEPFDNSQIISFLEKLIKNLKSLDY